MISAKPFFALLLLAGITFSVSNFLLNGSLNEPRNLGGELKSPADSLYLWNISKEPPFKYRVLHKVLVHGSYKVTVGEKNDNEIFFVAYRCGAFLLHSLAILAFYFLLVQINLKETAFAGAVLFALMPPLLLAYNVPVHTREDTLAYFLLIVGLLSIIKNNTPLILLVAVLGVLCRETLLILPFVNLFFNKNQNIYLRLIISAIPFGVFLLVRLYFGAETYDYWEGLTWNRNNMAQVIGFGYITFGFLWIPFFLRFLGKRSNFAFNTVIYDSAPSVFFLVATTTFIGGIFNEIRILYLLFPWVIIIGLHYYTENKIEIVEHITSKKFKIYAGVTALIMLAITTYAVKLISREFTSQYDIPYLTWAIVASVQVYLGIICLPYFYTKLKATLNK